MSSEAFERSSFRAASWIWRTRSLETFSTSPTWRSERPRHASQSEAVGNDLPLTRAQRLQPATDGFALLVVFGLIHQGITWSMEPADNGLVERNGRPGGRANPLQRFGGSSVPAGFLWETHFVSFLVLAELAKMAGREADRIGPGGHGGLDTLADPPRCVSR